MNRSFTLNRGVLKLQINKEVMPFDELIGVSERINPKRPFLFVSKVIGRYIPTSLKTMVRVSQNLTKQIPHTELKGNITVVSLSETALGLGVLVHKALTDKGIKNLNTFTSRHKTSLKILSEFKESHSHLPNHYVYKSGKKETQHFQNTDTLILVDDEITTGNTLYNLYKSLKFNNVKHVILLSLADWSNKTFDDWGVKVSKYSLIEGTYSWTNNHITLRKQLPYDASLYSESITLKGNNNFRQPNFNFFKDLKNPSKLQKDLLVVYYNELLPYCLSQYLQYLSSNKDVYFLSLSSSPIELSGLIKSKLEFSGFYSPIPVYLYNYTEFVESKNLAITIVTEPFHIPYGRYNTCS